MKTLSQIYRVPLVLALLSALGLISGLLADGMGDAVSWLMLGTVSGTGLYYALRRSRRA